jgi:protocatechuate 3,4-dioxygenase beta subunit
MWATLLALATHVVLAQSSGVDVEGMVTGRIDHVGIPEARVTFFNEEGTLYQASTDASGAFHVAGMHTGEYSAVIEKRGFILFPKEKVRVERSRSETSPLHLHYEMEFGRAYDASLTGRVLDSQDKPLAFAQVDLIQSPDQTIRTTADQEGRFRILTDQPRSIPAPRDSSTASGAWSRPPRGRGCHLLPVFDR